MTVTPSVQARARGFTLVEVMIVVAIIAILSAIAVPSYSQYVLKSRRAEAKSALLAIAAKQEQVFSMTNQYTKVPSALGYAGSLPISIPSANPTYYQIQVVLNTAATTYTATATAVGTQVKDKCGNFSVDQLGVQKYSGTATVADCW